jgi:hypothetical protein
LTRLEPALYRYVDIYTMYPDTVKYDSHFLLRVEPDPSSATWYSSPTAPSPLFPQVRRISCTIIILGPRSSTLVVAIHDDDTSLFSTTPVSPPPMPE